MALPPNPVSAPAAPLDPAMAPAADMPATEAEGSAETVLLTITTTPAESGTPVFKAYKGEMSEAPAEGEGDMADAGGGPIAESSDVGAVLKAAMDVMKAAEKDSGPSMSEDEEYKQGFSGNGPVRM